MNLCKAQTGTAANHVFQFIGKREHCGRISNIYRCELCGEYEEDFGCLIISPRTKEAQNDRTPKALHNA